MEVGGIQGHGMGNLTASRDAFPPRDEDKVPGFD